MLKIEELSKRFGGVNAVNGCSFEVKRGTITALIGPNGSGKTTVFNLVSGIMKPDSGTIIFDGKEITDLLPETISNLGVSRVFQQPRLFNNLTVEENLLIALGDDDTKFWKSLAGMNRFDSKKKEVKEALKLVGMGNVRKSMAGNLSYGQKRLVELARAILKPHKLLMLDEPVAGVNPGMRKEIKGILLDLKKNGETILMIEHDMSFTFHVADSIIVMDEGRVIAQGEPKEIRNNPEVLKAYLGE